MGGGMSQVLQGLYLGNIRDSEDKISLCRNGVTHILSVHNNAKPLLQEMSYLCITASDSANQNLMQHFKKCIRFIHESRLHGGGCLVHCLAGVSRSTTIVVAYLMTVTNLGWEDCLSAVKCVRSYVDPNFGFQQQLQEYQMNYVMEDKALRVMYSQGTPNHQEFFLWLTRNAGEMTECSATDRKGPETKTSLYTDKKRTTSIEHGCDQNMGEIHMMTKARWKCYFPNKSRRTS